MIGLTMLVARSCQRSPQPALIEGHMTHRKKLFSVAQEVYLTRDHLCVVMELAEGGDLAQRMEELHHYGVRVALISNDIETFAAVLALPCTALRMSRLSGKIIPA